MAKEVGCYHAVCSIGLTLFTLLFLVASWRFQVMFTEFKRVRRAHFLAHGAHGAQSMSLALALGTAETEADAEARRGPNTIKVLGRLAFHGLVLLCALLQIPYYSVCVRAYYGEQYACHDYPWTNCYTTRIVSQAMQFMAFTVVANEWLQTVLAWERKHQPPAGSSMASGGGGATGGASSSSGASSALGSPGGKAGGSARWDATSDLELSGGASGTTSSPNPLAGPGSSSGSRLGLLSNTIGAVTDTALEVGDSVTRAATEAAKNATVLIGRYLALLNLVVVVVLGIVAFNSVLASNSKGFFEGIVYRYGMVLRALAQLVLALSFLVAGARLHLIISRGVIAASAVSNASGRQREMARLLRSNLRRLNISMAICFVCFLAESILLFVAIAQNSNPKDNADWLASIAWFALSSWLPMIVPSLAMLVLMKPKAVKATASNGASRATFGSGGSTVSNDSCFAKAAGSPRQGLAERLSRAAGKAGKPTNVELHHAHQGHFGDGEQDDDEQFSNLDEVKTPYKPV